MNQNRKKKTEGAPNDPVEEMLREAEDAVMLKLSLNSHMAHVRPSELQPDLDSRFQALKSGASNARNPNKTNATALDAVKLSERSPVVKEDNEDDLLARFTALKASMPNPSMTTASSSFEGFNKVEGNFLARGQDEHDEEDEVQKIIMWAMDAARLDPSPSSDDEEDHEENPSPSSDNDEDCEENSDDDTKK